MATLAAVSIGYPEFTKLSLAIEHATENIHDLTLNDVQPLIDPFSVITDKQIMAVYPISIKGYEKKNKDIVFDAKYEHIAVPIMQLITIKRELVELMMIKCALNTQFGLQYDENIKIRETQLKLIREFLLNIIKNEQVITKKIIDDNFIVSPY